MTNLNSRFILNYDAPRPWGTYSQDSASPQMEALIELHDNIMFYLVIILFGVAWILVSIIRNYISNKSPISYKSPISDKHLNHDTLRLIWNITPVLIQIIFMSIHFALSAEFTLSDDFSIDGFTLEMKGNGWGNNNTGWENNLAEVGPSGSQSNNLPPLSEGDYANLGAVIDLGWKNHCEVKGPLPYGKTLSMTMSELDFALGKTARYQNFDVFERIKRWTQDHDIYGDSSLTPEESNKVNRFKTSLNSLNQSGGGTSVVRSEGAYQHKSIGDCVIRAMNTTRRTTN